MLTTPRLPGTLARTASCSAKVARVCALLLSGAVACAQAQLSDIRPDSPLPSATIGRTYSVTFKPVNPSGGPAVFWSITPGCLSGTGLFFTPQNGVADSARISGTPTSLGRFVCTVVAQDGGENTIAKAYELSIERACTAPRITSPPPPAIVDPGVAYTYTVLASGKPPHVFSALGLPPGLAIGPSTGVIAGVTQAGGTYAVTVIVTGCGRSAVQNFTLVVGTPPVALSLTSTPNPAVFGQDIVVSVHAAGGATTPSGAILLCVAAGGQFCAAPVGVPPPATPDDLVPPLVSATLDAGGDAAFTLHDLAIQNYVLQAYYGGDATHSAARSVVVDQFVIKGAVLPPPPGARAGQAPISGGPAEPIPALSAPALFLLSLAVVVAVFRRARRRA